MTEHEHDMSRGRSLGALAHRKRGEERIKLMEALAHRQVEPMSPDYPVSRIIEAYLARREQRHGRLPKNLRSRFRCWIIPAFGRLRLSEVTGALVSDWCEAQRSSGISERTIRVTHGILMTMFEHHVASGELVSNPARLHGRRPAQAHNIRNKPAEEVLSAAEVRLILTTPTPVVAERIRMAVGLCTGARLGETISLRFRDVIFTEPMACIRISRAYSSDLAMETTTKTDVVRKVPVHPHSLGELLIPWMREGWRRFVGRDPRPDDYLVPRNPTGRIGAHTTCYKRWMAHLKLCGLQPRRLHAQRHTFVSLLLSAGVALDVVERYTHTSQPSAKTAIATYAHYTWERLCEGMSRFPVDLRT